MLRFLKKDYVRFFLAGFAMAGLPMAAFGGTFV